MVKRLIAMVVVTVMFLGCKRPEQQDGVLVLNAGTTLFPWKVEVYETPSLIKAQPGGVWSANLKVEVDFRHHTPTMRRFIRLIVAVYAELRYDREGSYRSGAWDYALSTVFTTSGEPIARIDHWPSLKIFGGKNGSPFEGFVAFELPEDINHVFTFEDTLKVQIPADIEVGWWHPRVGLFVEVEGVPEPLHLGMFYDELADVPDPGLPLIEIGDPAVPKVPWVALANVREWGRAGCLPEELRGRVATISRTSFQTDLIIPPGVYPVWPAIPSLFPASALPVITDEYDAPPPLQESRFHIRRMEVALSVEGPKGFVDLGVRTADELGNEDMLPANRPFTVDMQRPGTYRLKMIGWMEDRYGRRMEGGGTYKVIVAMPLTFSTSCKPGTNFLVGNSFPAKVNILPPVPANVEIVVDYYPQSDPSKKTVWRTEGTANKFGHFTSSDLPLIFSEPGEYASIVKARYTDRNGIYWVGQQASKGIVAPGWPGAVTLHGGLTIRENAGFPESNQLGRGRYMERLHYPDSVLLQANHVLRVTPGPSLPYNEEDSIMIDLVYRDGMEVEPLFSVDVHDRYLAELIRNHATKAAVSVPRFDQTIGEPWAYLSNVILRGRTGHIWTWSISEEGRYEELPVISVSGTGFHPFAFPGDKVVESYLIFGIVRPGFVAVVGAQELDGIGTFWALNPDTFGNNINATRNGDLPGDVYRVQAGVVIKDLIHGAVHYDIYGSTVAIAEGTVAKSSVLPVGIKPLVSEGGRDHYIFLATDTHDALILGEDLAPGGMVFPNVPAMVKWDVRSPSGRRYILEGRADRRGVVKASPVLKADEPGVWDILASVEYNGIKGDIVGTRQGEYFVCAVGEDSTGFRTTLPRVTKVPVANETKIPLRWDSDLKDVEIRFAALMPGRVLEQGTFRPDGDTWAYTFSPAEFAIRAKNFDVRDLMTGEWKLGDTVVFQFCLTAKKPEGHNSHGVVRVFLRQDILFNIEAE